MHGTQPMIKRKFSDGAAIRESLEGFTNVSLFPPGDAGFKSSKDNSTERLKEARKTTLFNEKVTVGRMTFDESNCPNTEDMMLLKQKEGCSSAASDTSSM